jgi:hypothetical protein
MMARLLASFRRGNGNQLWRREKVPVMVPAVEIQWRNFVRDDARESLNRDGTKKETHHIERAEVDFDGRVG